MLAFRRRGGDWYEQDALAELLFLHQPTDALGENVAERRNQDGAKVGEVIFQVLERAVGVECPRPRLVGLKAGPIRRDRPDQSLFSPLHVRRALAARQM